MFACIYIQPQPFLCELLNLNGEDGLLDRFLVFASKPEFNSTETVVRNSVCLSKSPMKDFTSLFLNIYKDHNNAAKEYQLNTEAQKYYNSLVDNFADLMKKKYDSDSGKH